MEPPGRGRCSCGSSHLNLPPRPGPLAHMRPPHPNPTPTPRPGPIAPGCAQLWPPYAPTARRLSVSSKWQKAILRSERQSPACWRSGLAVALPCASHRNIRIPVKGRIPPWSWNWGGAGQGGGRRGDKPVNPQLQSRVLGERSLKWVSRGTRKKVERAVPGTY